MSRTQKEDLETGIEASLQLLAEENTIAVAEDYIEFSSEKRKKDASKPLYLKRI